MDQPSKSSRPPLILVANDQEWAARSLDSILGPNGYAVLRAHTGRQTLELARDTKPDLVVLDYRLPDLDGTEICRQLRARSVLGIGTPIVMMTSSVLGRPQLADVFAAGAWDFYSQPIDGELFLLKIATLVAAKREADRANEESLIDRITGLYNLRGLTQRAREIGAEALRHRQPLACVCFSTDRAESQLDAQILDEIALRVVEHLGQICRQCSRASDAFGRMGGRDFAVIAPSTEHRGAVRLVERLQQSLGDSPLTIDGEARPLRIRAGYSAVPNYAEASIDAMNLLLRAAAALRHSRISGDMPAITAFDDVPPNAVS
jgi:diguanylate cyclase (GGDEF)-like protein